MSENSKGFSSVFLRLFAAIVVMTAYLDQSVVVVGIRTDMCSDMNFAYGAVFNLVNGFRYDCWARSDSDVERPRWTFYPAQICYPSKPGTNSICEPQWVPGDGFFDSFRLKSVDCVDKPPPATTVCERSFPGPLKVTLHPDAKSLVHEVLSQVGFIDGESFDGRYFFNHFENPDVAEEIAFILGVSSDYLLNTQHDIGFVAVTFPKEVATSYDIDMTTITMNEDRASNLIDDMLNTNTNNQVLEIMSKYGTHYLAGFDKTDFMIQVFIFDRDEYNYVVANADLSDPMNFIDYAKPIDHGGYSRAQGKLKTYINDPATDCGNRLSDYDNGLTESIFKFAGDPDMQVYCSHEHNGPIKIRVGSISELVFGDKYPVLRDKWEQVLAEGVTQRFGGLASASIPDQSLPSMSYDFYNDFNPILTTHTATAYTSIIQMYFNLGDIAITNPQFVEHMFIISDVLEIGSDVEIPGTKSVHLICRHFISHSSTGNVPIIRVRTSNVFVVAEQITGYFQVKYNTEEPKRMTYTSEYVYVTNIDYTITIPGAMTAQTSIIDWITHARANMLPDLYTNDANSVLSTWLHRSFYQGLQQAVISVDNILSLGVATSEESVNTALKCLDWILNTLSNHPNGTLSDQLEHVLNRALILDKSKILIFVGEHVLVPRLTYSVYKPYYDSLYELEKIYEEDLQQLLAGVALQKQTETIVESQEELNQNILALGKYLVEATIVNQEKQNAMVKAYNETITKNLYGIDEKIAESAEILAEIEELQVQAGEVGDIFERCLAISAFRTIVQSMVAICKVLFSPYSNPVKAVKELKGMKTVYEKLRYALKGLNAMFELYEQLRKHWKKLGGINRVLEGIEELEEGMNDFPTEQDWNDFEIELDQYTTVSTIPNLCQPHALDFRAIAFKISSRGQLYIDLSRDIQSLQYEVVILSLQQEVVTEHANRLNELSKTMDQSDLTPYEANTTNLFEIGAFIQMRLNEVRLELSQTYLDMDASLQHYTLQPASPFAGYSTADIVQSSVNQMKVATIVLGSYPHPPTELNVPMVYTIENVNVKDLLSKSGQNFTIEFNDPALLTFVRVRVVEVRMYPENIQFTTQGIAHIQAMAAGSFQDRDINRFERNFTTSPMTYDFIYFYETNEIITTNRAKPGYEDWAMKMTPFTTWFFRMDPTWPLNDGLTFSRQEIKLRFELYLEVVTKP